MTVPDTTKHGVGERGGGEATTGSHPIAHPIAAAIAPQSPQADAVADRLGSANDGAPRGTTPPATPHRTRPTDLAALASRLSDRDHAILRSVAEHQFLTGRQITVLHFADHAATSGPRIARRTLERLREWRLLGALERRIGGVRAGSDGMIHYLDVVGDQLLRGRTGRTTRRPREPSERFVRHRLAVADTHLELIEADRRGPLELEVCTVEPAAWRRYPGTGGAAQVLKADLYAETGAGEDLARAWFIEVDLGSESMPTLLRKCHDYETYRRSGIEQHDSGGFPIVIWSVTHRNPDKAETRRAALRDAIAADRTLPPRLFRVIAPQQLIPTLQPGGQQ
ncbi:replication-relaxation family protein [Mycolicibacterium wolinskyi]|uniref:replication-relaxation family protein n=1 Tax=Mycolicibacterium TaxID=1866885 RepID=UPI000A1619A1|nr:MULTISPECIES: replication-relaxation family protein [Mycolicibacterium]MCV7286730.1 replication-relaxation family protein [Mycolicibacterium wolinskyi]MCV7293710.1 replication-relaxation family protein [Mycolicibacterium goodii]